MRIGFVSHDNNHGTFGCLMNWGHNPYHIHPDCLATEIDPRHFDLIIFNLGDNWGLCFDEVERAITDYIKGDKRPTVLVAFEPECRPQSLLEVWKNRGMIDLHLPHDRLGLLFESSSQQQYSN